MIVMAPEKDEKIKSSQYRMDQATYDKLVEMAKAQDRSINSMIIVAIKEYHSKIFKPSQS